MKKLFSLVILLSFFTFGYSQDHDNRLLQKYSVEELDKMKSNSPNEYKFLNTALDKAIFIGEIPQEKGKDVKFDGELELDPSKEHTFLSLGIVLKDNEYQYFKIIGTDQMVGVLPKSLIK